MSTRKAILQFFSTATSFTAKALAENIRLITGAEVPEGTITRALRELKTLGKINYSVDRNTYTVLPTAGEAQ